MAEFETSSGVVKKDNQAINKINMEIHKLKADMDNFEKNEEDSKSLASVLPQDFQSTISQSTLGDSA